MFTILSEMFARPGNGFSPLPVWVWNDRLEREELVRQIGEFHKHGVNGFIISPGPGMQVEGGFLGEEYLSMVQACLEAAQKRRMLVMLASSSPEGQGMVAAANPLFAARGLYAVQTGTYTLSSGEEVQMRMALRLDAEGKVTDVITDTEEVPADSIWYDFVLGFTGGVLLRNGAEDTDDTGHMALAADFFNPEATEAYIASHYEVYRKHFAQYFGTVIVGMYANVQSLTGHNSQLGNTIIDESGKMIKTPMISWTYDFHEVFGAVGGDAKMLAALLFPTKEKRWKKDGEYYYKKALCRGLRTAFYEPLQNWCFRHGVVLTGYPAGNQQIGLEEAFGIPGQHMEWDRITPEKALTAEESALAKCAADMARHRGISRSLCAVSGGGRMGERQKPICAAELMWQMNFLFARGVNMIVPQVFYYAPKTPCRGVEAAQDMGPGSIWWDQYGSLAAYIKRLCWLNTANTNNPHGAVLCDAEEMPVSAVKPLYEMGYTFNYLTMEQLEKAHVHAGKIYVDRYAYDTLLIHSRLRLTPALVRKIGEFVTQGGRMHRNHDFGDFVKKNIRKTSYFDAQTPNIRFVHLSKSGYPFFLLFNEGDSFVKGNLVSDQSGACKKLDPFSGTVETVYGEVCEDGLRYPCEIAPWSVVILGINTDVLPELGKNPKKELSEIAALSEQRQSFWYVAGHGPEASYCNKQEVFLCFDQVRDRADVTVNGKPAGTVLYRPYRLDITDLLTEGENQVSWTVTATRDNSGNCGETGVSGARVEISTIRDE